MTDSPQTLRIEQLTLGLPKRQIVSFLFLLKLVKLGNVGKYHQPAGPAFAVRYGAVTCTDKLTKRHQTVFDKNMLWPTRLAEQCLVQRQILRRIQLFGARNVKSNHMRPLG